MGVDIIWVRNKAQHNLSLINIMGTNITKWIFFTNGISSFFCCAFDQNLNATWCNFQSLLNILFVKKNGAAWFSALHGPSDHFHLQYWCCQTNNLPLFLSWRCTCHKVWCQDIALWCNHRSYLLIDLLDFHSLHVSLYFPFPCITYKRAYRGLEIRPSV